MAEFSAALAVAGLLASFFLRCTEGDHARGGRDLGVRRVLADEDDVPVADAVDAPVDGDVGAGRAARVDELRLADEVADLGDPAERARIHQQRARGRAEDDADEAELVERVPIDELEGRITTSLLTPYPPGIPLLIPGEVFNKKIVDYLKFAREFNAQCPGFETDIHGLVEQVDAKGKLRYYADCVKK